jgi:hypothetical protein
MQTDTGKLIGTSDWLKEIILRKKLEAIKLALKELLTTFGEPEYRTKV